MNYFRKNPTQVEGISIDAYVRLSLILVQLGLECQNFPARKRVINYS